MEYLIGVLIGISISIIALISFNAGVLRIGKSDADGPYLFLELERSYHKKLNKKYAVFKIVSENYIPRDKQRPL